jgi:prepilin-type N-terminal cleavage/methylation domain-containing protein
MTRRAGFSLVELMVVIFIIGLLCALLLPAIQGARESARKVHCRNNLKQLGLAAINFEQDHRKYAVHTEAAHNEATWITLLYPYLEEGALFTEWARAAGYGKPSRMTAPLPQQLQERQQTLARIIATPVTILYCPSRRPAVALPLFSISPILGQTADVRLGSRTDYAINGGASHWESDFHVKRPGIWEREPIAEAPRRLRPVRAKNVKDGLSSTYLIGEKSVTSDNYETGTDPGDDDSTFACPRGTCVRFAKRVPVHDVPAVENCWSCHNFGSAHPTHWNAVFCDGSVHSLSYEMSFSTHQALASRSSRDRGNLPD